MTLAEHHYAMLHTDSALTDEVIEERGYRTLDGPTGYDDLKRLGFSTAQAKQRPGLLLPLHTTDGTQPLTIGKQPLTIYRPDTPSVDARGRPRKYLFPTGVRMRLDCPPRCRPGLADPQMPLWITEGQKKADCLASHGAVALDLLGVWNFKGKNDFGGTTILVDFDYVPWQGREVRLVFDADVSTSPEVRKALERLTELLSRKGAAVRQVYLPAVAGQKTGVDDYLAGGHTLQELEALIEAPRPQPQAAPSQIELLEAAPAMIRRPLALIQGRMYAAIWPHVKVTRTEALDKQGNVIRLAVPEVTTEQRLSLVRDDGVIFGDGMDKPLADLGIDVHLSEIPPQDKLWTTPSIKAYRAGTRPDPVQVYRQVHGAIDRFLDFDRSLADQSIMCDLVTCYVMATWFLDAFTVIGYLWPNGESGSGKTKLLTLVGELGYLGQLILAGGSYACLRDFADYGATLCFDDAEHVMDLKRGDPDKRALLLAGNRRGNSIPVKEKAAGDLWKTRHVQTFCPRLFSAIRMPDMVLASRTVIVPLIRTANKDKGNADPLDYGLWPTPRADLVNQLWALALYYGAKLPAYDALVPAKTTLVGRALEPWRALLAVAHWLTDCGVDGLSDRMTALSLTYQQERPDLEPTDLTALTLRSLCHYAINSISAISAGTPDTQEIVFSTSDITALAKQLIEEDELSINAEQVSVRRIGRVCGRMRFKEKPRAGGKGKRQWVCTKGDLRRWLTSYGVALPEKLFFIEGDTPPANGTNGIDGTNGTGQGQLALPADGTSAGVPGIPSALLDVGDWITPLSLDGVIIPAPSAPPPYRIDAIEHDEHAVPFARLDVGTYWPLAQCEPAAPPAQQGKEGVSAREEFKA